MRKLFLPLLTVFIIIFISEYAWPQAEGKERNATKQDKVKWYSFEDAYKLNKKSREKYLSMYLQTGVAGVKKWMQKHSHTRLL